MTNPLLPALKALRERGTGHTTEQMRAAAQGAYFVWCNGAIGYPINLSRALGRNDLRIVSLNWLCAGFWRGLNPDQFVLDHAVDMKAVPVEFLLASRRAALIAIEEGKS